LTAGLTQTPFGAGPITAAAERTSGQASARLAEIAIAEGTPARQEVLGEAGRRAAQRYIDSSGEEGRRLYGAARAEAGTSVASAQRAVADLDRHIAELAPTANTNAPEIAALNKLRADLVDDSGNLRELPIDAIRRLRTGVRAMAQNDELRGSDFQRRATQVLSELREDISEALPDAARAAFREADRHWQVRLQTIDDVMETVIGPKGNRSAEAVAQRLIGMSRGDSSRLRRFIASIPEEEAGIIRGSVIHEMGRASSGQQGAAGNAFSLESFLTNWDKLPERARSTLFRGESRAAIDDLAKIAEGSRQASRYANRSNTGGAANVSEIGRALSYGAGFSTLGASVVLENLTGRLLASPNFARFLVWTARGRREPGEIVRKLGRVAAREPGLSADIIPIRAALEGGARAAAAENNEDPR
jgi:hypothetical protein